MKKLFVILCCLLLIITIVPKTISLDDTANNIIYVDDDNVDGPWDGSLEHPYRFIQEAIDNANDGNTIYVFNGVYNKRIVIDKSVYLIGENKNKTIVTGSKTQMRVIQIEVSNVSISNFSLIDSNPTAFAQAIYASKNDYCIKNVKISNCVIRDNGKGIYLVNVENITISGCDIYNQTSFSIWIQGLVNDICVDNCLIYNNGKDIGDGWIYPGSINIYGGDRNWCSNITISNCSFNDILGENIEISRGKNIKLASNTIWGINALYSGMYLGTVVNVEITSNNIYQNHMGIYCLGYNKFSIDSLLMIGNDIAKNDIGLSIWKNNNVNIYENNISTNSYYNIEFIESSGIIFKNNINESDYGVFLRDSDNVSILNNLISDSFIGIPVHYSKNISIVDNFINNSSIEGIFVLNSSNNNISGNLVPNNFRGISISGSNNNNIFENTIDSNEVSGIYLENSISNEIFHNLILNNCYGIELKNSSNNLIIQNNFFRNMRNAYFSDSFNLYWGENYWGRSRLLPKIIFGKILYDYEGIFGERVLPIPFINIDWNPAKEPYNLYQLG
ncbi:MAG: right-handed parallel beta-helix repeat-containing protein [Candidatus Thermoplasmatota archaeon]|nr:right-handed parallel beta-helix repeat-containing protein [Candidatus Thermoplasmatota archaeon]